MAPRRPTPVARSERERRARSALWRLFRHPAVELGIGALILVSIALIGLELTLPPNSPQGVPIAFAGDAITVLFAVELVLRFLAYPRGEKGAYWKRFWLDWLAVLPLLRVMRILRVLRLARALRLGLILNRRLSTMSRVLQRHTTEVVVVGVLALVVVLGGAIGIQSIESQNPAFQTVDQTILWSVMSAIAGSPTPDVPLTGAGRAVATVVALGGLVLFAMTTGLVSALMVERMGRHMDDFADEIAHLEDHVVICGFNREVEVVLRELQSDPHFRRTPVVLVAEMPELPRFGAEIDASRVFPLRGDYTRLDVLRQAGIERASVAIVLADKSLPRSDQDRDARSVLAAMLIEKENPDVYTCVELLNPDNRARLVDLGVEEVIIPDAYSGGVIAAAARTRGMIPTFDDLFSRVEGSHFGKVVVGSALAGRTVLEAVSLLKARPEWNALLVALERGPDWRRRKTTVNPPSDTVLEAGDRLVVVTDRDLPDVL